MFCHAVLRVDDALRRIVTIALTRDASLRRQSGQEASPLYCNPQRKMSNEANRKAIRQPMKQVPLQVLCLPIEPRRSCVLRQSVVDRYEKRDRVKDDEEPHNSCSDKGRPGRFMAVQDGICTQETTDMRHTKTA